MKESIELSVRIPASAERIYKAWLDSGEHSGFTGSPAEIVPEAGGKFKAWDGYIMGTTLELEPFARIVQAWRTTEFPIESPDSKLEITLEEKGKDTLLTLKHTEIPEGQGEEYRKGWEEFYFKPLEVYFRDQ